MGRWPPRVNYTTDMPLPDSYNMLLRNWQYHHLIGARACCLVFLSNNHIFLPQITTAMSSTSLTSSTSIGPKLN